MYWKTIWIPQILGAVFGGVFVFRLGKSKTPEILLRTMEEFTGMIRESKGYTGWAEKTERKLIRNGAKYHFGKTITPMKYLTGRIVLAFLGAISLLKIGCGYAVLAATVLYFLPELLLIYMNERDNRNMLTEIKLIYQALEVQIRAGIYVADALTECCQSVKGFKNSCMRSIPPSQNSLICRYSFCPLNRIIKRISPSLSSFLAEETTRRSFLHISRR